MWGRIIAAIEWYGSCWVRFAEWLHLVRPVPAERVLEAFLARPGRIPSPPPVRNPRQLRRPRKDWGFE